MSFKLVERAINAFLASPTPEVMCLIGKWGIGKTFSWKFFLKKAKDEPFAFYSFSWRKSALRLVSNNGEFQSRN
jgi:hypothetical protein